MLEAIKIQLVHWPTLFWNVLLGRWLKVRPWWSEITDEIIVGAVPYASDIPELSELGVRGMVNTCQEFKGLIDVYQGYGIEQFYMPTIDYTHPKLDDILNAIEFIEKQVELGHKVYVHCKAGRARSATVALCYLCKRHNMTADQAQELLLEKRKHVNRRIKDRPVVKQFMELINSSQPDR